MLEPRGCDVRWHGLVSVAAQLPSRSHARVGLPLPLPPGPKPGRHVPVATLPAATAEYAVPFALANAGHASAVSEGSSADPTVRNARLFSFAPTKAIP
jgi:hypothetical protein